MSDSSAAPADGSNFVTVSVNPDPGFVLVFDGMKVTEELGKPFLIELNLSSGKAKGNIEATLGSSVTVTMTDVDKSKSYFNGILTRAFFVGLDGGAYRYHVEVRPFLWLLTRTRDCKIFQNMSAWDIINKVIKDNGFDAITDSRQNSSGSQVLEYCVQYRESAYDFVMRLMEQFGIYYYFTHTDGEHKLVFADDPNSHTSIGAALPFYTGQTEQRAVEDHVSEWASDLKLQSGAHTTRDYNFTTPSADLTSKALQPGNHPHGSFETYDYPGLYDAADGGTTLADVRMQAHKAQLQVFTGRSNARTIRAGVKLSLTGTHDDTLDVEYVVTKTEITMTIAEGASDTRGQLVDSNRVTFSGIKGATPYRMTEATPKPMIRGPQTAIVVGESGQEITTDQYGRIKVQFPWDRVGTNDQNSSCWVRVAQSWGGAGFGAMVIPRIGMEVVIIFLEGNPDRPICVGVVYNATQTVPYALPDNKTRTTFKTNSSSGGGGSNEIRFEDKKGSEEVFFQAQKDFNKTVLNNETVTITQDHATTVTSGKHATTVSAGNHTLDVTAGGSKTTTGQAMEVTAGTSVKLTANTSIELTVGGNSIKIDASGITINGAMITGTASGKMALDGGGMMELTGGLIKIN